MCLLVESLMIREGKPCNLNFHQMRFDKTRMDLLNCSDSISLEEVLKNQLSEPENYTIISANKLCKCRVVYNTQIIAVEIAPYIRRKINTLKIVKSESIEYSYKYEDRTVISNLFELKGECDDILIIKNERVTDTSFSNVLFFDGVNWYTPTTYLLPGTKRANLLNSGVIKEKEVKVSDIVKYSKIRIINALNDFEDEIDIPVSNIVF